MLTEVTNSIFDASVACFVLLSTFPLAIEKGEADGLNQGFVQPKATQVGADYIPSSFIDLTTNASQTTTITSSYLELTWGGGRVARLLET